MNAKPIQRYRAEYRINEGLTLDFWARDEEEAWEIAENAEVEGLITYSPMWEPIDIDQLPEDCSDFDPINDQTNIK